MLEDESWPIEEPASSQSPLSPRRSASSQRRSPRSAEIPTRFPAAGELLVPATRVYARPDASSRVLRTLRQVRPDLQLQTLLAIRGRFGRDGKLWYELSLPGRPNGQRGWIRADRMNAHPVENRIVVRRHARTIRVVRIKDRKVLLRGTVAVGSPAAPTPLGRNFYITQGFVPDDPFYGPFALATSAYSSLTDWPGGGVAGIHGTSRPDLLGQAVSHGCVRVRNDVALRLNGSLPPEPRSTSCLERDRRLRRLRCRSCRPSVPSPCGSGRRPA